MANKQKSIPSTSEIHDQIQSMFEAAGKDLEPISVESQAHANTEISKIVSDLNSPHDWDFQVDVMTRTMQLINGGLLGYDQSIKELSQISQPLIAAAKNLRSTLVKQSCLLIVQLVHELGSKFDSFGDVIIPLSNQTSHGTQIIAESCKCVIIHIAKNCPTKRVFRSIIELSKMKSSANRQLSAECLYFVFNEWVSSFVEQNLEIIIESLHRLMEDASQDTRRISRSASQLFLSKYPQFEADFYSEIDEKMKPIIESKTRSRAPHTSFLPVPKKRRQQGKTNTCSNNNSSNHNNNSNNNNNNNYVVSQPSNIQQQFEEDEQQSQQYEQQQYEQQQQQQQQYEQQQQQQYEQQQHEQQLQNEQQQKHKQQSNMPVMKRKGPNTGHESVRSKSTLPSRPNTFALKANLKLEKGFENDFLDTIEEYVNTNQQYELSQSLNSIVAGLFVCGNCSDSIISNRAIKLIENLVHFYPKNFLPHLSRILEILFSSESNNDVMLHELQATYDPNSLLYQTEKIQVSPQLLKFIADLCDDIETDLTNNSVCQNIYEIASSLIQDEKTNARRVIRAICRQNKEFFDDVQDDPLVTELINEYQQNPEYPRFNPRGVSIWCDEVRKFIKTDNFNKEKTEMLNEIVVAISLTNDKKLIIVLMVDILKTTNNEGFEIFLPAIIRFYRDKTAKNILKLVKFLIATVNNENLLLAIFNVIRNGNADYAKNAIDIITEVVKSGNKEKVKGVFDQIITVLLDFIEDEYSEIRRSVINAFVELSLIFPEQTSPFIEKLSVVQQKLIIFYLDQRM